MKFKVQHKHNQLNEKITAQHLALEIDIAHETHVTRAVNFTASLLAYKKPMA